MLGVADTPSLAAASASGIENTAIPLDITAALSDTDGSETLSVTLTGIPAGAALSNASGPISIIDGSVALTSADLSGLTITPAEGATGDFTLSVTATASEDGTTAEESASLSLTVSPPPVPALTIDDINVSEAASTATLTVTRSGDLSGTSSVDFTTVNGTANDESDFTGTDGTLNFTAGQATATITIELTDDEVFESDEGISVTLPNAVNATIGDDTGAATIANDDAAPSFSIEDVSIDETDGTATFTVKKPAKPRCHQASTSRPTT